MHGRGLGWDELAHLWKFTVSFLSAEPDSTEELEVSPYEEEDEDYLEDRPRSDIDDID